MGLRCGDTRLNILGRMLLRTGANCTSLVKGLGEALPIRSRLFPLILP